MRYPEQRLGKLGDDPAMAGVLNACKARLANAQAVRFADRARQIRLATAAGTTPDGGIANMKAIMLAALLEAIL